MDIEVDVMIAGAGPVGLMLANQLGLRGVRTLLIERNASTVHEPRAIGYDDETCRALQSVGLEALFAEHAGEGLPIVILNKQGDPILRVNATQRPYGHPWFGTFYQPTLERILAEGLSRFDCVDLRFEHELIGFDQSETAVHAIVRCSSGHEQTVRADWLVGCDGGGSTVRRALGMSFEGSTYKEKWLVIDCANDPLGRREANFLCDNGRPAVSLPAPGGRRRWEFLLHDGEDEEEMQREETIRALLSIYHDPSLAEIERSTVYTFHARAADHFRVGRVLLAGDAAHLMPPFAGQGMNSGIRDAFNLGWKLALISEGRAGPELMDSYERERRWHVKRMTQLAMFLGWVVMPTRQPRILLRNTLFKILNTIPWSRDFLERGGLRPAPYLGRRGLFCRDSKQLSGRMFRQIEGRKRDGTMVPLDDLLGDGFAVVGIDVDPLRSDDGWTRLALQLGARSICIHTRPTPELPEASQTLHVTDTDGVFAGEPYRSVTDILVRPDRFVMAATDGADRSTHAEAIVSLLGLTGAAVANASSFPGSAA